MILIIATALIFFENAHCGGVIANSTGVEAANASPTASNVRGRFWEAPISNETELESGNRNARTWWYSDGFPWQIGILRIENGLCTGSNNLMGRCYTIKQCARVSGGVPSGFCAYRYGRCCVTLNTCGATSAHNNTYFQSPGFPNAYGGGTRCTFTVQKCDDSICQVRLTFVRFSLAPPIGGVCSNDALTISGGTRAPIRICGENDGQHIYLDFNNADNIVITVDTSASVTFNRYWQIQVAQIECEAETRAPSGCLQYFYDGTSGTVSSFNFGTSLVDPVTTSRQIRNQNYGICILMQPGYCSVDFTPVTANSFVVSETGGVPNFGQTGADCPENYVIIPGGTASAVDRYCGSAFPAPVTTNAKPFMMYYVTSALVGGGTLGFSLTYSMNACAANNIIL